jgi:hypothetical protein
MYRKYFKLRERHFINNAKNARFEALAVVKIRNLLGCGAV